LKERTRAQIRTKVNNILKKKDKSVLI